MGPFSDNAKPAKCPLLLDNWGEEGPQRWISNWAGGYPGWIKKILHGNIINLKKWISQGGQKKWTRFVVGIFNQI